MKIGLLCVAVWLGGLLSAQNIPQWLWNWQAGGSGDDRGVGIALDSQGNQYLAGVFNGTAVFGGTNLVSSGAFDLCVAKLDSAGNWLWAVKAGGSYQDHATAIAVDSAGNAYVTGYFEHTAWFGSTSLTSAGNIDVFIAKLDANGNWLWAKRAGGGDIDSGVDIAVDGAGDVFVTGSYSNDASFGATVLTGSGWDDVFVARLDSNGNWLGAVKAGGSSIDRSYGIALDSASNAYVTGSYFGSASFGTIVLNSGGDYRIFVAKLGSDGIWNWATQAGGPDLNSGSALALDSGANVYVTGVFLETADFGGMGLSSAGSSDLFAAKLDPQGNWLWARRAGGSGVDNGNGIAVDAAANVYLCGSFSNSADFGATILSSGGSTDIFAAKLDLDGNWQWAVSAGGSSSEEGLDIALHDASAAYVAGWFMGAATFAGLPITSFGGMDAFAAKLGLEVACADELAPTASCSARICEIWPNPVRKGQALRVQTEISARESGSLDMLNLRGQRVASWNIGPGSQLISLDTCGLASGVYLCQLKTQSATSLKRVVLMK